jgi:polyisoprenoid-binding protein YceI
MRVRAGWKLPATGLVLALLAGCPLPRHAPPPPVVVQPHVPAAHSGVPFQVAAADSLLTILVYRGGTLASAGHNHVIASHALAGTVYVPADLARSSFELHLPVASLTVDEPGLRAAESAADFPPDISDSAREGTRHNMLSAALLDAAEYQEIVLRALAMTLTAPGDVRAQLQSSVRGELREFEVTLHYQLQDGTLTVSGAFPLRQSTLGLQPFSALLGALQVQDEMQIRLRLVAHAAH